MEHPVDSFQDDIEVIYVLLCTWIGQCELCSGIPPEYQYKAHLVLVKYDIFILEQRNVYLVWLFPGSIFRHLRVEHRVCI